jgi:molybdopterin-containing oxidoreductase family membrane subunit
MELFTALYSDMPHHLHHFQYLFTGLHDAAALTPWIWTSVVLAVLCVVLLILVPAVRRNHGLLAVVCVMVVAAIWIEKGMAMVVTGFIPSPLGHVTEYTPTLPEIAITVGVYAFGFFVLTVLYRIVLNVRERLGVA